jgi:hypothetical protein
MPDIILIGKENILTLACRKAYLKVLGNSYGMMLLEELYPGIIIRLDDFYSVVR